MATSLTTTTRANVQWQYSDGSTIATTSNQQVSFGGQAQLANGTGANQADKIYFADLTITASGNTTLDLDATAGTPLKDCFGNQLTFARVKLVYIELLTTTAASSITVGNATNPFVGWFGAGTHTESVQNGGFTLHYAPGATAWPVTGGTADILKIVNADGSLSAAVRVIVIGASA